ncbi:tyrosine--tRNA ligase [Blattabacterium cuenoti]|uniref:tyrosine--tRNA ligase n=1 Tax=Blattabacterium cuenoti TaxID=1653831 RepID=UPI00163C1FDF|nr:tyrosine--tRNA ligase [Blattabacterium cuenoti]
MKKNIIDELSWRGLITNKVPGVEKELKKRTTIYLGFDPTSDSLHLGSLLPIIILIHFQKMGHKLLVIIGGATGMIGDPSERKNQRLFLNQETIQKNIESIKKQLSKLLGFYSVEFELLNNINWIKKISLLEFIRNVGKHITVNNMISKDSVKKRINHGMSFTELTYSLIQGYDFLYLNMKKNCLLQVGGSDQWGNIITGIEIIRKETGKKAYGITFPLITKSNGVKFGKSEKGENIWLDEKRTSPFLFYQFWMNISDTEIENFIKIYTFYSKESIEKYILKHRENPEKRSLQKKVASEIIKWIHGKKVYKKVIEITNILFCKKYIDKKLFTLDERKLFSIYENIPHLLVSHKELKKGIFLLDLLKKVNFFSSKNKANKALKANSIFINKKSIKKNILIQEKDMIRKKYILFQFGKKNFFIVKFE